MTDFSWTQDRDKCCELFSRYTALRKATQTFMSERFYKKISARDMESAADRLEIDTHGKALVFDSENDMTVMFDYALFLNDANGGPVVQRESPKLAKGADAATRELLDVFSNYRYTWLIPINAVPGIGVRCLDLLLGENVFVVDRGMGVLHAHGRTRHDDGASASRGLLHDDRGGIAIPRDKRRHASDAGCRGCIAAHANHIDRCAKRR